MEIYLFWSYLWSPVWFFRDRSVINISFVSDSLSCSFHFYVEMTTWKIFDRVWHKILEFNISLFRNLFLSVLSYFWFQFQSLYNSCCTQTTHLFNLLLKMFSKVLFYHKYRFYYSLMILQAYIDLSLTNSHTDDSTLHYSL